MTTYTVGKYRKNAFRTNIVVENVNKIECIKAVFSLKNMRIIDVFYYPEFDLYAIILAGNDSLRADLRNICGRGFKC